MSHDLNDATFICDTPDGTKYILSCEHVLRPEAAERLSRYFEDWLFSRQTRVLILGPGFELRVVEPAPAWPDAVFCAA